MHKKGFSLIALVSVMSIAPLFFFAGMMDSSFLILFLIGSIFFFIGFFNTPIALGIVIIAMLFSPEISAGSISARAVTLRIEDIVILIVLSAWACRMAVHKELGLLRRTPLNRPLIIYVSVNIVATLWGVVQGTALVQQSFFFLLKYMEYYLLFFMVANSLHSKQQAKGFVLLLLIVCVMVSFYALTHAPGGRFSTPFQEGKNAEPNTLAGYLILMMALIAGLFVTAQRLEHQMVLCAIGGLSFYVFVFTLSRSGWVSFVPMILAVVLLHRRYRFIMIGLLAGTILMFVLRPPESVQSRIQETFTAERSVQLMGKRVPLADSALHRIEAWETAFRMLQERPLLGVGVPGGRVMDNQFARILIETGIVGFCAFLFLIRGLFQVGFSAMRSFEETTFERGLAVGFLAGLVGLLVMSLSASVFILIRIMEPFWFLAAIIAVLPELSKDGEKKDVHAAA